MNNQNEIKSNQSQFYRFQLFQGIKNSGGKIEKTKIVGMSYMMESQDMYTLRLWTLLNDKFFLVMSKNDSSNYLIMSRETNKNPNSKMKYFWNVIGNGKVHSAQNYIELHFDLFERPIYMSIFPESKSSFVILPEENLKKAA